MRLGGDCSDGVCVPQVWMCFPPCSSSVCLRPPSLGDVCGIMLLPEKSIILPSGVEHS